MKIQEIAEKAGVSTATISRVFSHHPNIRPEVRAHVFAIARKFGYVPRLSRKQRNIAVISPYKKIYPIQSYVEMVISELTHELSLRGYRIEVLTLDNFEQLERSQFCAGVAIGVNGDLFQDWDNRFAVPLIIVDQAPPANSPEIYSVRSNEKEAMDLAIDLFLQRGCKKIGCIIYGESGIGNADTRRKALLESMKKHKLKDPEDLIRFSLEEGYVEEVGKLLRKGIDALFCPGGNAGIIASYALSLYNKRIPEDISLIASERTIFSRYATPPQTTISQDYGKVASCVADALDARLSGRDFPRETILPYKLILRDSVR